MSSTSPGQVVDVTVTLEDQWAKRTGEASMMFDEVGMTVETFNSETGIVEGSIPSEHLRKLERLDCVAYVRTGSSYPKKDVRTTGGKR